MTTQNDEPTPLKPLNTVEFRLSEPDRAGKRYGQIGIPNPKYGEPGEYRAHYHRALPDAFWLCLHCDSLTAGARKPYVCRNCSRGGQNTFIVKPELLDAFDTDREFINPNELEEHEKEIFNALTTHRAKRKYFIDAKTFSPKRLADEISKKYVFARYPESGDLYVKNDEGFYESAEDLIAAYSGKALGDLSINGRQVETYKFLESQTPYAQRPDPRYLLLRDGSVFDALELKYVTDEVKNPFFTNKLGVLYDPLLECPVFDAFFEEAMPNKDDRTQLLENIAYGLYYARPIERCNFFLYGTGANGKGTYLSVLRNIIGKENYSALSHQELETNRFAVTDLVDKFMNIHGDASDKALETTSKFKQITGADAIRVERKGKDAFPLVLPVKFTSSANTPPRVPDHEPALFRRIILKHFAADFDGREDITLKARLERQEELDAIFTKAIQTLPALLKRGHFTNAPSTKDTQEVYQTISRPVFGFVKECLNYPDENEPVQKTVAWSVYNAWAKVRAKPNHNFLSFCKALLNENELSGVLGQTKTPEKRPAFSGFTVKREWLERIERDESPDPYRVLPELIADIAKEVDEPGIEEIVKRSKETFGFSENQVTGAIKTLLREGALREVREGVILPVISKTGGLTDF